MPWSLELRDGKHCVVKKGGSSPVPGGCHDTRADAIKHQRALYANESRMASMYDELDARPEPEPPAVTLKIDALTAAVMERIAERQSLTDQALVAALEAIGTRESVVNVHPVVEPTPVTVEAPHVTVEAPNVMVAAAEVNVPAAQITVRPPDVNVTVENIVEHPDKKVLFTRNLQGQIVGAETSDS